MPEKIESNTMVGCVSLTILLSLIVAATIVFVSPYYESKRYNKITGAHTTYWDAFWLELRVQDQPVKTP